jgi:predicted Zn-dependent protease
VRLCATLWLIIFYHKGLLREPQSKKKEYSRINIYESNRLETLSISIMTKKLFLIPFIALLIGGCVVNQVTGRKQLNLVSDSELRLMAVDQYKAFLSENKVLIPSLSNDAAMVERVGTKIAAAITEYYTGLGKQSVLDGYAWEFNTIDDKETANAWCMPGGKVVVYTGLLPVSQNEDGLAIVMGHEIAHAIANHGNERMSQAMAQQFGGIALELALAQKPEETKDLFLMSYGIGSQVGALLPWSRQQETEADKFGLIFAAMAGYDPREAIPFWQRMSEQSGESPPEFLSTHPSNDSRIRKLNDFMPEALKYYDTP